LGIFRTVNVNLNTIFNPYKLTSVRVNIRSLNC